MGWHWSVVVIRTGEHVGGDEEARSEIVLCRNKN
jgi:hypothetical protein